LVLLMEALRRRYREPHEAARLAELRESLKLS
jgi:hypothetical protein